MELWRRNQRNYIDDGRLEPIAGSRRNPADACGDLYAQIGANRAGLTAICERTEDYVRYLR